MEQISGDSIPELSVPLSMGVQSGDFVFVSGQGPLDLETGAVVGDTVAEQTRVTLDHVGTVLQSADLGPGDVVKVNAYLTDADHYDEFNEVYAEFFDEPYPARSCVVTDLIDDAMTVEVEAIARR